MDKLLVIYHKACDDGFGAAWAIHRAERLESFKENWGVSGVEYVGGVYGAPAPDCHGRDVVFVDFCYPPEVMEELIATAKSILVLDHHKSARLDMIALAERKGWHVEEGQNFDGHPLTVICNSSSTFTAKLDMNRSGAAMAWDHFRGNTTRPILIDYIQDRDLWTKQLPNIDSFTMALRSYPMTFESWDNIHESFIFGYGHKSSTEGFRGFIGAGSHILRYQNSLVDDAVRNSFWVTLTPAMGGPIRVRSSCCLGALASEVGEALATKFGGIGLTWSEGKYGLNYSLRSRGDNAPDVSVIAKSFGGGGHAKAAGFKSETPVHVKEKP